MTKPDSTDAGGVTHVAWCPECGVDPRCDEDGLCAQCGATVGMVPDWRQLQSALATLTREREAWRDAVERALGLEPDPTEHTPEWAYELVLAIREIGNGVRNESGPIEPATPPAPLPGGQGPVTVAMLHQLFYDAPSDTFENFVCYIVNTLADRLEQGGEGREG